MKRFLLLSMCLVCFTAAFAQTGKGFVAEPNGAVLNLSSGSYIRQTLGKDSSQTAGFSFDKSPSCIQLIVDGSQVQGIVSWDPFVLASHLCVDSTQGLVGQTQSIDTSGMEPGSSAFYNSSVPISSVQILSVSNGPGCALRSTFPRNFGTISGVTSGSLSFSYPRDSGIANFISISTVDVLLTDANGATAQFQVTHYCRAPASGGNP